MDAPPPPPGGEIPHGTSKGATAAQVKAIIRRRLRKQEEHMEMGLNIYPMMDMMTILLVFLIMQFAAAQADVVQSADLQIPYSTMQVEPAEAISVQISRNAITVDGVQALPLRNGTVDPSLKRGGGTGFLIIPLEARMRTERDQAKLIAARNPQRPFRGEVRIIADKRTPFRTLAEVIYTLGQTEYKQLHFVVLQGGQGGR